MQLLILPGGARLTIMNNAEQAAWEANSPIDQEVILNTEALAFVWWDEVAEAVNYIYLGGSGSSTIDLTGLSGNNSVQSNSLIDKDVSKVFRQGIGRKVVTSATSNTMEVFFDSPTGTIYLPTGDAFDGDEWVQIEYK